MKILKLLLLGLVAFSGSSAFSQTVRLTEDSANGGLDIFLMPGINFKGQRLLQFSFLLLDQSERSVESDNITLITSSQKTIILKDPVKDTMYYINEIFKNWFSSFVLTKEQTEILKSEQIAEVEIIIDAASQKITIMPAKRKEIHSITATYF